MRRWRLLDTGCRSAAENMALDDVVLECRSRDLTPNTIRFLQFNPPAVLVGYHQSVEQEVRMEFCKSRGIEINRRITGGGAIFFDTKSLGWEVIASKSDVGFYSVEELYERMCEGPILGLRELGVQAKFRPKNDIEVNGRKISGTGGAERDDAFLFQGTLLIDFDVDTMIRALRIPIVKLKDKEIESAKQRVTCIKWELGREPKIKDVKKALRKGFEKAFKVRLVDGGLTNDEAKLLKERLSMFQSEEWIFLDRRPLDEASEVSALRKTLGGLIRVSLAVDKPAEVIKSVLITGDFFIFPSRAVMDLEARLKGASCNEEELRGIINEFFEITKAKILGITPEDLVKLILEALEKTKYTSLGLSIAEANHVYTVKGNAMEILNNGCEFLLLPYCAKLLECEYRKREGCVKCSRCSIGQAYKLAEENGLTPITIQNFEHLMDVLKMFKQNNAKGYIGCCCEAFYCKHQDKFEAIGVPGILIDIDSQTCYDLGKEMEAYKGLFESQTQLKINLLSKLLAKLSYKNR